MRCWWLLLLSACGRLAFDPLGDATDARLDGRSDGAGDSAPAADFDLKDQTQNTGPTATLANITMQSGDTLVVVTHRSIGDTSSVTWGSTTLVEDEPVSSYGTGPLYLSIWSTYVATSATANVIVTGSNNTTQIFVLAIHSTVQPAFDKGASNIGTGTIASSGATALTASANEVQIGALGGDANAAFLGNWDIGWVDLGGAATSGLETEVAARRVSNLGLFSASYQNFTARNWGIGIATYKLQ